MKKITALFILAIVAACSDVKVDRTYPADPENVRKQRGGKFFESASFFSGKKNDAPKDASEQNVQLKSSALWTSSVEVLSALLPISVADEKTGLIVTEWYQDVEKQKKKDSKPINLLLQERLKINLLVKGNQATRENLVLTIFRQTKDNKGEWIDNKPTNQDAFVQSLKDKIIQKAKAK